MKKFLKIIFMGVSMFLVTVEAHSSVESTLGNFQRKILGTYLPMAAMLGLLWAGFGFVSGRENAKRHLWYAIIGCCVGFGAESIVMAIRSLVN